MTEFERGYEQALVDINKPMDPIVEKWEPTKCPRCTKAYDEECNDGYYVRSYLDRCPYCGQALNWIYVWVKGY